MTSNSGTIYYTTDGSDPRTNITGATATSAKTYAAAVNISGNATIKARAKTTTDWSALSEATFVFASPNAVETPLAEMLAIASYPNPFNEFTRIQLTLPYESNLQMDIYSIDGRLMEQLFNGKAISGINQFEWTPSNATKGIYICQINFDGKKTYLKLVKK
jgi:hypothetical protein